MILSIPRITMPERFCTMFEKCKFLSMGYISALTKARVLIIQSKNVRLGFKVMAKDNNNISYTVRYGFRVKAQ